MTESGPAAHGVASQDFAVHGDLDRTDCLIFICIALLVFATRQAFAGPVYFVDGPLLVATIRLKWFVIQSPGYWLFAHLGGLFQDPATGLAFWVKLFSSLGGGVFYVLCRLLGTRRPLSLLAALTYSFSFHLWFAGEIHSTYAAEILFPVLTLCCFLKLGQRQTVSWAVLTALSSGLAIALRPSDGIFLLPLWMYLLWRGRYAWKIPAAFGIVSVLTFLAWYLPTQHASRRVGFHGAGSQVMTCLRVTSLFLLGITPHSIANVARVYLPLLVAYWALLPVLLRQRGTRARMVVVLWAVPGLLFFTFGYMADPTYIVFLSGAFVLAAVMQRQSRLLMVCLTVCLLWNVSLFLCARPVQSRTTLGLTWNLYVTKYCAYGVKHQWKTTMAQAITAGKSQ